MKKNFVIFLILAVLILLASCGGNTAETKTESLKLGLGVISKANDSKLEINVAYAAVLIDKDGRIVDCQIDELSASSAEESVSLKTKGELGNEYGMKEYSGIGKEWFEQVNALEEYCKGKTKSEIMGIAIDENGKATDETLKGSATIAISGLIDVVVKACNNAKDIGAKTGDSLKLASANISESRNAINAELLANVTMAIAQFKSASEKALKQ